MSRKGTSTMGKRNNGNRIQPDAKEKDMKNAGKMLNVVCSVLVTDVDAVSSTERRTI
jgi:hypothetical protein